MVGVLRAGFEEAFGEVGGCAVVVVLPVSPGPHSVTWLLLARRPSGVREGALIFQCFHFSASSMSRVPKPCRRSGPMKWVRPQIAVS